MKELFDCDLAAELSARALYEEAATHCHSVKDYVSRDLFEKLMHDEEEHIDFLETQLDLVAKLGAELYAQHHTKIGTVVSVFSWRAGLPRGPQSWSSSTLTPTNISTAGTYFDQAQS